MTDLRQRWLHKYHETFEIGIGIATGWVTVVISARGAQRLHGARQPGESGVPARGSSEAGQILVTERT